MHVTDVAHGSTHRANGAPPCAGCVGDLVARRFNDEAEDCNLRLRQRVNATVAMMTQLALLTMTELDTCQGRRAVVSSNFDVHSRVIQTIGRFLEVRSRRTSRARMSPHPSAQAAGVSSVAGSASHGARVQEQEGQHGKCFNIWRR